MIFRGRPSSFVKSRRTRVLPNDPVPPVMRMDLSVHTIVPASREHETTRPPPEDGVVEKAAEATNSGGIPVATSPECPVASPVSQELCDQGHGSSPAGQEPTCP